MHNCMRLGGHWHKLWQTFKGGKELRYFVEVTILFTSCTLDFFDYVTFFDMMNTTFWMPMYFSLQSAMHNSPSLYPAWASAPAGLSILVIHHTQTYLPCNVAGSCHTHAICEPSAVIQCTLVSPELWRRATQLTSKWHYYPSHRASPTTLVVWTAVIAICSALYSIPTLFQPTPLSLLLFYFTICHSYFSSLCVDHHFTIF